MHLRDLLTPWEIKHLQTAMRDKRQELIDKQAAAPRYVLEDAISQYTRLIAKLGC